MRVDPAGSAGPKAEDIPCARRIAFCAPTAAEVFQSVVYQPQIWARDPFDVDTIHADARDVFARLLRRAASTPPPTSGRILLLWGEAGSGKTHLMRAFRGLTHEPGIGYFAYLQMTTEAGNYGRYLLSNLIASLDQPYAPPAVETSGLMRLSTGVFEAIPGLTADEREAFRAGTIENIPAAVHDYADRALGDPRLAACDVDLIRAMIYLQRDDPRLKPKVLKWLRCEDLSTYDRAAVGELVPRTQEEHPIQMVAQIGRLMAAVQMAPLVVCVDQLEDMFQQESGAERFRNVVDTLVSMVDGVPTAVVVLSCLEDYYKANRQHLIRPKVDRLEHDPEPVRLTSNRTLDEIEALVARRLDYLYEDAGLQPNSDNPTCPFTREQLKPLTNFSTRKVLDACRAHHQRCIAAGEWVAPDFALVAAEASMAPSGAPAEPGQPQPQPLLPVPVAEGTSFPAGPVLEQAWNEFQTAKPHAVPDEESALAGLLAWGIEHCAVELASGYRFAAAPDGRMISIEPHAPPDATAAAPFLVAVCDKGAQGGALGRQVHEAVQRASGRPVVLVRSSAFPRDARTAVSKAIAKVIAAGGRRVQVEDSDWRALVALRAFHGARGSDPAFEAWQRESRPLSQLAALRKVLALDQLPPPRAAPSPAPDGQSARPQNTNGSGREKRRSGLRRPLGVGPPASPARAPAETSPPTNGNGNGTPASPEQPAPVQQRPPPPADLPIITGPLLLGATKGFQPAPVHIEPAELKQHMSFLGAPGSGKTTAALSLIEQLLMRGVPAVMIDRKGDLCRYADPAAWESPEGADAADGSHADRLRQLRERIDVVVYTPGATSGRPLSIPLVPDGLRDLPSADREQLAGFAAGALGGMMGYKPRGNDQVLTVILAKAIEVLAGAAAAPEQPVTVKSLHALVDTQDESLLNAVGGYEPKHYRKLAQDLLTLRLQHGRLIEADGSAEPLDVDRLLGRGGAGAGEGAGGATRGRARLSIISTQFLGGQPAADFWVAQFLVALDRWRARSPSDGLQAIVLLDEADQYLPAMRQPATKAPLESLLRRARSAGLGLMLATQSPGDFDYRCRENIRGWLVGRVTQTTAINKLRPMFAEARLDAAARLPGQQTGEFYLLRERAVSAVRTEPSLVETRQLPEQRILELARAEFGI